MKSKVYFRPVCGDEREEEMVSGIERLLDRAGYESVFKKDENVLVKLHFGEKGNKGYIRPRYVKPIIEKILLKGGNPFLADTNTLYKGQRSDARRHLLIAHKHGFNIDRVGCPVIIADGLLGQSQVPVSIPGAHFSKVHIASDAVCANAVFGLAHITGHMATGMGGQIKNIGMGLAGRGGKLAQHHNETPLLDEKKCTACGTCQSWCPEDAISIAETAVVDRDRCIGCGECLAVCPEGAPGFEWKEGRTLQERIAEYAFGAVKEKLQKVFFMNFILGVTRNCDCLGSGEEQAVQDIGILASRDMVAIDAATPDVICQKTGQDFCKETWQGIDYPIQYRHAEKMGLGSTKFDIVEV